MSTRSSQNLQERQYVNKGVFDKPPTNIQTYAFKWTIENLKAKLENPLIRERIDAAEDCKITDSKVAGNQMTLTLSLSVLPGANIYNGTDLSSLTVSLLKKSVTTRKDVTVGWSVTIENPCDSRDKVEFKMQKDVVSLAANILRHGNRINVIVGNMRESPLYDINLYMEVIWPEKSNISEVRSVKFDHTKNFKLMMTSGKYADIQLTCKGKQFHCHKFILAAHSPVFDAMFANEDSLEMKQGVVTIEDMEPEELEAFLKFLYTGVFNDEIKQYVKALLAAADKYDVKDLMALTEIELARTMDANNAIDIFLLAHLHNVHNLKKKGLKTIVTNFSSISKQAKWQDLKSDQCDLVGLIEVFAEIGKV